MAYNELVQNKLKRAKTKYDYYDDRFAVSDITPYKFAAGAPVVGWCGRAIDLRANKTNFDTFENDTLGFNELFTKYHVGEALEKIRADILIAGCAFLAVSGKRVMPFTSLEATGTYSWNEQNLSSGLAVYRECTRKNAFNELQTPDSYIEYLSHETLTYNRYSEKYTVTSQPNITGRPLMVVLTHHSSTHKPFGHSVLKRSARLAALNASRTYKEMTIAGHFYNKKVNVLLGVDTESSPETVSRKDGDVLLVGANENGQIPQVGEFAQHALAPFKDSIAQYAESFCAATMLTRGNLGDAGNAPQSPEQQRILSDDLVDDMKAWHKEIGRQIKYLMTTIYMLENGLSEIDDNLQAKIDVINPVWLPLMVTDLSKGGDAIQKLSTVAPAVLKSRSIWRNMGLCSKEIDDVIASLDKQSIDQLLT